jgi:hypothetical protein
MLDTDDQFSFHVLLRPTGYEKTLQMFLYLHMHKYALIDAHHIFTSSVTNT